jgi:hypothetical protein
MPAGEFQSTGGIAMFTPDLLVALWPLIAMGLIWLYERVKSQG